MSTTTTPGNWTGNSYVQDMHNIPRFSSSNIFNITAENAYEGASNKYVQGLIYFPYGIFVFCFFAWMIWGIMMICRSCLKCLRCAPAYDTEYIRQKSVMYSHIVSIRFLSTMFYSIALVILIANQIGFVGRMHLNASYNKGADALDFFNDAFTSLDSDGESLLIEGNYVLTDANEAVSSGSCSNASVLIPYTEQFIAQVGDYEDIISPISGEVANTQDAYNTITFILRDYEFWGFYGSIYLVVLPFLLGLYYQSKLGLQLNMAWVSFVLLLIWYFCCAQMAFLMGLADFCISPTQYAIPLIPAGSTQDVIAYYLTCSGTNPFQEYINGAYTAADELNTTVTELLATSCPGNADLLSIQGNVTDMYSYLDSITSTSACPPFEQEANDILHNAMCYQLFMGTYIQWISQFVMSGGIFFLLLTSSVIYQYFGRYWNMEEADIVLMQRIMDSDASTTTGGNNSNTGAVGCSSSGSTTVGRGVPQVPGAGAGAHIIQPEAYGASGSSDVVRSIQYEDADVEARGAAADAGTGTDGGYAADGHVRCEQSSADLPTRADVTAAHSSGDLTTNPMNSSSSSSSDGVGDGSDPGERSGISLSSIQ